MEISKVLLSNSITAQEICIDDKFYFVFCADGDVCLWVKALEDEELPVLNASRDRDLFWIINNIVNDFAPGFICIVPRYTAKYSFFTMSKIFGALSEYYNAKAKKKEVKE